MQAAATRTILDATCGVECGIVNIINKTSTNRRPDPRKCRWFSPGNRAAENSPAGCPGRLRTGLRRFRALCTCLNPQVPRQKYLKCEQFCTDGWCRIAFNQCGLAEERVRPAPRAPAPPQPAGPGVPCAIF